MNDPFLASPVEAERVRRVERGYVILTGNPNCGKTTLFNALTGLRARVANYPGVTVERKEGRLVAPSREGVVTILDLPGTYSLTPKSLDEAISRDVLLQRLPDVPRPELVVVVLDASNLERNLYYATQVLELGYPTILALNMIDLARANGHIVDPLVLEQMLGVPVLPMVASSGQGVSRLKEKIFEMLEAVQPGPASREFSALPPSAREAVDGLVEVLERQAGGKNVGSRPEAMLMLADDSFFVGTSAAYPGEMEASARQARARLAEAAPDWEASLIESRYARIGQIYRKAVTEETEPHETVSDKLDRVLTHKFWGLFIFLCLMGLIFQSIFSFAPIPMDALQGGVSALGETVRKGLPPGPLNSLLVDGVIAGVGAVIVFLPQICLLFLFIGLLEDTGYMARAAFLMDRLMTKVGLHGKSFIPMLSSFACAIPGIMATRTIESPKDRLVTIMIAPLMSCSARLPVYTLLIGACIPDRRIGGIISLAGLTMLCMYLLGMAGALVMAWLFKKTLLKGGTPMLIMELPPYRLPVWHVVLRHMWDRSALFLRRAGTVILGISILLWFLAAYPRQPQIEQKFAAKRQELSRAPGLAQAGAASELERLNNQEAGEKLRASFAGQLGRAIEPLIAPLGFDWKIGIGIVASFAAREVFVSTMSTVYNVGQARPEEAASPTLAKTLRDQRRADGSPLYTPLLGITLMVFYVFALQCVSTVAIVRRETNSWKWPLFQWIYMGVLAWTAAFVAYHGGLLLGFR